jgi:hypothetical protein
MNSIDEISDRAAGNEVSTMTKLADFSKQWIDVFSLGDWKTYLVSFLPEGE